MGGQGLVAVGVPPAPVWLLYVKIAILVLSLIVLALGAYSLSLYGGYGYYVGGGAGGLDIFIAIWSFIFYGGGTAVELWAPHMFYRIVALIGYIFSIIFWLSAWAWSASVASIWLAGSSYYSTGEKPLGGALAGCAGLGAIAWILTIVHLAFFIRACVLENTTPGQAELGQVKTEVPPQQYQQPYPAQQQYPAQQPYPAQQAYPQQPYPSQ